MDSILQQIGRQEAWEEFLAYRLLKKRFDWRSFKEADAYVEQMQFEQPLARIADGEGFGIPLRSEINKLGTGKKRVVYSFPNEEMEILRLTAHLLYRYDDRFSSNCYAFRRGVRVRDVVTKLNRELKGRPMWGYKIDIHNYFNSISIPLLLPLLQNLLQDDPPLYAFFEKLLNDDRAWKNGEVVHEPRGVMAGLPIASFLANVYLMEVDRHFEEAGVIYARYSDDIILFAEDEKTLLEHKAVLLSFFEKYRLEVNPSKENVYRPGEAYEFLGFRCAGSLVDISRGTRDKLKGKIRRKARALRRWASKKQKDPALAVKAFLKQLNRSIFDAEDPDDLSWSRYFFPVINRTEGLREIDRYVQQMCRYILTGRHYKGNFRHRYSELKALGYKSLVHEYYTFTSARLVCPLSAQGFPTAPR